MVINEALKPRWIGKAAIQPGIGVFMGTSGDNEEHCHWAHQLCVGYGELVALYSGTTRHNLPGAFIKAGTKHKLLPGPVLSIYLDPTSLVSLSITTLIDSQTNISQIPQKLIQIIDASFSATQNLAYGISLFIDKLEAHKANPIDQRLDSVLLALHQAIQEQKTIDRNYLARIAKLSPSRFSHWFKEQTGMPLRSYRKWLRLIQGVEVVLSGQNLTKAAYQSQFSDQAHFTRTFIQAFGLPPSEALGQVSSVK